MKELPPFGSEVLTHTRSSNRRLGVLDSTLQGRFKDAWRDRGLDRPDEVEDLREHGVGWVACSHCHDESIVSVDEHNKGHRWLLGGKVLVCLECGADLT
jgi:hypothetical protein